MAHKSKREQVAMDWKKSAAKWVGIPRKDMPAVYPYKMGKKQIKMAKGFIKKYKTKYEKARKLTFGLK